MGINDMDKDTDPFRELTWGDLTAWVGRGLLETGRKLQRKGSVKQLSKTEQGGLLAWIQAEEVFATHVGFDHDELFCHCGCQGEGACEHGIAIILEYISYLKKNMPVPVAASNDQRFYLL
jgi:uncharacterized Zn finger protein